MAKLFANSGDPDQTPRSTASDLGLHCLPVTLLRVSRLQWVKLILFIFSSEPSYLTLLLENGLDFGQIRSDLLSRGFKIN